MKMLSKHLVLPILAVALVGASSVRAQIVVPNGSFEDPASTSDQTTQNATDTLIEDWTATIAGGTSPYNGYGRTGLVYYAGTSSYDTITGGTGSQGAFLNPYYGYFTANLTSGNATNNDGSIAGSTGYDTLVAPDTTYTLSADIGIPTGVSFDETSDFIQGSISLQLVDSAGTVFATQSVALTSLTVGSLVPETLTYTSGAAPSDIGDGLKINFLLQNTSNNSHSAIEIDNVTLSGPSVPEPCTYAMLLIGACGLGLLVRRHRTV